MTSKAEDFDEDFLSKQLHSDINNDVDMKAVDDEFEDFDFRPMVNAPRVQVSQMNRLVSRIEEASRSQEDDDSQHYRKVGSSAASKERKTDKYGNYRYFDESEDDDYFSEEDEE